MAKEQLSPWYFLLLIKPAAFAFVTAVWTLVFFAYLFYSAQPDSKIIDLFIVVHSDSD